MKHCAHDGQGLITFSVLKKKQTLKKTWMKRNWLMLKRIWALTRLKHLIFV